MTDRQKALDDLLIKLKTSPHVTSEGFVNGYRVSALVGQLRKNGHRIRGAKVSVRRTKPTSIGQSKSFYVPNGYVKYTYINGPKQPGEKANETNAK